MSVVELFRPEPDRKEWAARISAAWNETREAIFEAGRLLIEAKGSLVHGEWMAMIERDLPFKKSTSEALMSINRDQRLKSQPAGILPTNWSVLAEITTLKDGQFEQAIDEGVIRPDMERKDLRVFKRKLRTEEDKALAESITSSFAVHHCAIEDVTPDMLPNASVDAIITDPPYPPEYLPTFSYLADLAERTLKPGGWCVVMTGIVYLPEVIRRLEDKLTYRWQYIVTTPGGANVRMSSIGVFQGYKPVLIFQKPPTTKVREWWSDVIVAKAGEQDKSLHKWQQSEKVFEILVERFSRPDQLIVDPFAGSGTTGRAAVGQGRHFWGCDIDPECAKPSASN